MVITQQQMSYEFALRIINTCRHPKGWVTVEFEDKSIELPIQIVIMHLPLWEVYRKLNLPVYSKNVYLKVGAFSKDTFSKAATEIYLDIFTTYDDISRLDFKKALWSAVNNMDDFGAFELNEHHCGISIYELVKVASQPSIKQLIDTPLDEERGTVHIERTIDQVNADLIKQLSTRGLIDHNCLLEYLESGLLNRKQFVQVLYCFGLRSEVSDKVIKKPVRGSSLSGMKDICELAIENQAARKSVYYNHEAIKKSQYFSRKLQLLTCSIKHIYPGSCGSTVTLPFTLTAVNYKKCVGKNIVDPSGNIFPLTKYNIEDYVDKEVNFLSPIGCRHTDGVCETCIGLLHKNLTPNMNLGINSAANMVQNITQLILSTKHFNATKSQVYVIPDIADKYIERGGGGLYFKPRILANKSNWKVGFSTSDIRGSITDLHHITEELPVPEERYSTIASMFIKSEDGDIVDIPLQVDDQCPFLTIEFLLYMKTQYEKLERNPECLWIPMQECKNIPIFRTSIINDSMMGYVKTIIDFNESGKLAQYKDASLALRDFSNMVFDKVSVNILPIEVVLKAHLVTSPTNWSIPVIEDIRDVKFSKTIKIIANRTISNELGLQGHKKFFASAKTYISPHESSPFDTYYDI